MRRYRLNELTDTREGHVLSGIIPGQYLCAGGMGFKKPGQRTHPEPGHIHDDCEVFILLQGRAKMEIDGVFHEMTTGDIIVVEPGEEHHLISDEKDPCVNLWMHAADHPHPDQERA